MSIVTINFYETNKPYGCFSNFSRHSVEIEGQRWLTAEHFFQAAKFTHQDDVDAVRNAKTPFSAAQLGRERGRSFRSDWAEIRDNVMLVVLRAKFTQHATLAEVLASTNGARLVEHTSNDTYWADGGDGLGANRLGQLLEQVRSELPPWPEHPDIEPLDNFWQMGGGQDCLTSARGFYASLSGEPKEHYQAYFPVPK